MSSGITVFTIVCFCASYPFFQMGNWFPRFCRSRNNRSDLELEEKSLVRAKFGGEDSLYRRPSGNPVGDEIGEEDFEKGATAEL